MNLPDLKNSFSEENDVFAMPLSLMRKKAAMFDSKMFISCLFHRIRRVQLTYHCVHGDFSLPLLQGFSGLLPAADLFWRQAQQPAHLLPEEVTVSIINGPIVSQYLHSRHLVALEGKRDCLKDEACMVSDVCNNCRSWRGQNTRFPGEVDASLTLLCFSRGLYISVLLARPSTEQPALLKHGSSGN